MRRRGRHVARQPSTQPPQAQLERPWPAASQTGWPAPKRAPSQTCVSAIHPKAAAYASSSAQARPRGCACACMLVAVTSPTSDTNLSATRGRPRLVHAPTRVHRKRQELEAVCRGGRQTAVAPPPAQRSSRPREPPPLPHTKVQACETRRRTSTAAIVRRDALRQTLGVARRA